MTKEKNHFAFLLIVFLIIFSSFLKADILPLKQIKPGMKGKGLSVFKGNNIEEFEVEIIGVIHNVQPGRNVILGRLKNQTIDKTGVLSGMSGSPVYINGQLIGAVALSFPYSKEAIAGITPIEEMMAIGEKLSVPSVFTPRLSFKKYIHLEDLIKAYQDIFPVRRGSTEDGQLFSNLAPPLIFNGVSSSVFEKVKPYFMQMGFAPVLAGSSAQELKVLTPPEMRLQPGDAVGVQLVSGDLNISAVGTVTTVEGNKILAFGHPLYNLGAVDYAMTKADVLTVVPSLSSSFKLAEAGALIGRFSQDRTAGVMGEIGRLPQFVPVNISLFSGNGEVKEFKINIVNDKILTPLYLNVSLLSLLSAEERAVGDLSLEMRGNIYLENGRDIKLEDLFAGNFDASITNLSGLLTSVVYFLTNNEFKDLDIHKIDLMIRASEQVKYSYLEKVWLDKYDVLPGERILVKVYTRNFRGLSVRQEVGLVAPPLPSGSEFYLIVADALSMQQIELSQYRTTGFIPRNLNHLIRVLSNLRKNNRIYFRIVASKPGLFLKGEELPNLPPTMKMMFTSPRAAMSVPIQLERSTLGEYQYPVPYVFKGAAIIPIKIK
ncbi:MAG: hypothetical protein B5M54_00220 [Candidatus Aminicenantes bacterium 4484_214]|nr:MAG: hypothetical protein B5M54_00220 [Candidatus Aminicenantes bacterium 4484_214]RLE10697.1 MAG: hypothetical protein DRJ06_00830 [Candidatus Aminicenantes bacterium]